MTSGWLELVDQVDNKRAFGSVQRLVLASHKVVKLQMVPQASGWIVKVDVIEVVLLFEASDHDCMTVP